jgi:CRP-like cAMP-binding protein
MRGVGARVLLMAAPAFQLGRFSEGDVIVAQGDDLSGSLYLVLRGSATVVLLTDDHRLLEIGRISSDSGAPFFGGLALAAGAAAAGAGGASVVASDEVWLLVLRGATHAKEMTLLLPDWHDRLARAAAQMARINSFRQLRDDERQLQLRLLAAQAMRAPDDGFGEADALLGAQRAPVRARATAHSLFVHASRPPLGEHELPPGDDVDGDRPGRGAPQTSPIKRTRSAREMQVVRQTIRSLGATADSFGRGPIAAASAATAKKQPPADAVSRGRGAPLDDVRGSARVAALPELV